MSQMRSIMKNCTGTQKNKKKNKLGFFWKPTQNGSLWNMILQIAFFTIKFSWLKIVLEAT